MSGVMAPSIGKQMNTGAIRRIAAILPAALLGIVAFTLVLIITEPPGPGLDPDALHYMGAAESLASSLSYRVPTAIWSSADSTMPLAHFPPGFSTALALPVRLGMPPMQAARLVNALAAGVTVAVLVFLVSGATTPLAGILLAVALFGMNAMHEVHVSVLSEPLFLACLALTLAAMTCAPARPLRAGIPAALAALTRYAGAALVGAVVLWQLVPVQGRVPLALRLRRAALALLPALLLQGTWVLRTRHTAGAKAIRRFAVYTRDLDATLWRGGVTLRDWLVPDPDSWNEPVSHRGALALAAAVVLLALALGGARRAWTNRAAPDDAHAEAPRVDAWRLLVACGVLLACYLGMILVSRLLADPAIPLDERILAPALLLVMVMAATTLALWWDAPRSTLARIAVCGALLGWFAASASATNVDAYYALTHGSDFAGEEWRRSELLEWARTQGARHPLYSNWPAAVYFHLHRPARDVPRYDDPAGLAAFADTLRAHDGRVLAFDVAAKDCATSRMLTQLPGLHVVARGVDGVVLEPAKTVNREP